MITYDKIIRDHLYPSLKGNMFTKHGQEVENKAKQEIRENVIIITDEGTVTA